jgi:hypothetical protein
MELTLRSFSAPPNKPASVQDAELTKKLQRFQQAVFLRDDTTLAMLLGDEQIKQIWTSYRDIKDLRRADWTDYMGFVDDVVKRGIVEPWELRESAKVMLESMGQGKAHHGDAGNSTYAPSALGERTTPQLTPAEKVHLALPEPLESGRPADQPAVSNPDDMIEDHDG